jgi:hypothetical protein
MRGRVDWGRRLKAALPEDREPYWRSMLRQYKGSNAYSKYPSRPAVELSTVSCRLLTAEKRRRAAALHRSDLFELGVAFYEFFGAAAGEGH